MRPVIAVMVGPGPRGITLLEVLIACGLLIVGLSTMAAILPLAGFRLAQANLEDRASLLASNALAEATNRGLVAADVFPTTTCRTVTFGKVLGDLPSFGRVTTGREAADYFASASAPALDRCGSPRTFLIEDELMYGRPQSSSAPVNAFSIAGDGGLGTRAVKQGPCWGATLVRSSTLATAKAGDVALLTIAVFRKDGTLTPGLTTSGQTVELTRKGSFYEVDTDSVGTLLRACSWVLAIPPSPTTPPTWFQIMSSWTLAPRLSQSTQLIFKSQNDFGVITSSTTWGSKATVFAFEGLVRVDQHPVTLQ